MAQVTSDTDSNQPPFEALSFHSFRAGPGWNCISILILLESYLQTCTTYIIAECTVNKLLMMDKGTLRNM